MASLGEPPSPPPLCRGGQGDHTTALNLVLATLAALRLRDRTGKAQCADVTLYGTGMWTLAGDLSAALDHEGAPAAPRPHRAARIRSGTRTRRATDATSCSCTPTRSRSGRASARRSASRAGRAIRASTRRPSAPRRARELTRADRRALRASATSRTWARALDEHKLIWAPVATLDRGDRRSAGARDRRVRAARAPEGGPLRDAGRAVRDREQPRSRRRAARPSSARTRARRSPSTASRPTRSARSSAEGVLG